MKTLVLVIVALFSLPALALPQDMICSYRNAKIVIPIAQKHSGYDKNIHCSVSCMLGLRCNTREVLLIGVLKEGKDLVGPGDCDEQDYVADKFGVDLVRQKRAKTDQECLEQCDLQYR
jgi:hypothetical protein